MVLLAWLALSAVAAPPQGSTRPLPAWVDSPRLEGFLQLYVDPATWPDGLEPLPLDKPSAHRPPDTQPERAPHEAHPGTVPTPAVVLVLKPEAAKAADVDAEAVAAALRTAAIEGLTIGDVEVEAGRPALRVKAEGDPQLLLELAIGETRLADIAELRVFPRIAAPPSAIQQGSLPVENTASARATVRVNGQKVGEIGPYVIAVIHGVPAGLYDVHFELPNGYVRKARAQTQADTIHAWSPLRRR